MMRINPEDYVSAPEFAQAVGVASKTITRALTADEAKPDEKKRFPGAFKMGEGNATRWFIPRTLIDTWERDPRGRKSSEA